MIRRLTLVLLVLCGLLLPLALPWAPPASADDTILTGLVSYWELDEESGTRNDAHGTNHLTDNNTVGYAAGVVGNAASFVVANSESLSRTDNASLSMGSTSFSICGWLNLSALPSSGNYNYVFSKLDEYRMYVTYEGYLVARIPSGFKAVLIDTGVWNFYCMEYDLPTTTLSIYLNNSTSDSGSFSDTADGTSAFSLGSRLMASSFWNGALDETGLWKRVHTADERTWLYNSGAGRSYAELVAAAATPTPTPTSTSTPTVTPTGIPAGTPAAYSVIMPSGQTGTMYATVSAGEGFSIVLLVAIVLLLGYQAVSAAAEKWKEK